MRRIAASTLLVFGLASCADGTAPRPADGGAGTVDASPQQVRAALCEHIIKGLEPMWERPLFVDPGTSQRWLDMAMVLEQDAAAFEQLPDPQVAGELRAVADAAYGIALVTEPGSTSTPRELEAASETLERRVNGLAKALPDDACVDPDRAAHATLRNALVAAVTFHADHDTYDGLSPADIAEIEPAISFVDDRPATVDAVTINLSRGNQVVFTTLSQTGQAFCIGRSGSDTVYGTVDAYGATSASDCGDGQPWPGVSQPSPTAGS